MSLVCLFGSGCQSLLKPEPSERIQSAQAGAAHFGSAADPLYRSTFLVFSSDEDFVPSVVSNGDNWTMAGLTDQVISGVANAITPDGYLLTASHVVKPHIYVVGWVEDHFTAVPVRVVNSYAGPEFGAEFALLHIEAQSLTALPLGTMDPADNDVYAIGFHRAFPNRPLLFAGHLVEKPASPTGDEVRIATTDIPFWHGDSGGALLTPTGELIGVNTGYRMPWWNFKVSRISCVPSPERIQGWIAADRAAQTAIPPPR